MKPRRSILSVPGHVQKMHAKALNSEADGVMLDMEDSVPLDAKEAARSQIVDTLRSLWHGAIKPLPLESTGWIRPTVIRISWRWRKMPASGSTPLWSPR
jgi:citrate lyase beta subunit